MSPSKPQNHHSYLLLLLLPFFLLLFPPSPNNPAKTLLFLFLSSAFFVLPPAPIQCRRDHLLLLLTTLHYGSLARPCLPHFQLQNQNRASPVPASLDAAAAGHWHCIPLSYALALFFDSVFNNMISGVWCDVDVVEFSYYGAPTPTPKEQLYTELVDGLRGSDSCIGFGSQVLLP
ncbi:hypothetical protein S83_043864 [Arachis hypogaea]